MKSCFSDEYSPVITAPKSEKGGIYINFFEFIVNFKILLALVVFMTLKNVHLPR